MTSSTVNTTAMTSLYTWRYIVMKMPVTESQHIKCILIGKIRYIRLSALYRARSEKPKNMGGTLSPYHVSCTIIHLSCESECIIQITALIYDQFWGRSLKIVISALSARTLSQHFFWILKSIVSYPTGLLRRVMTMTKTVVRFILSDLSTTITAKLINVGNGRSFASKITHL